MSSYLDDNPFVIARQKRAEAKAKREAEFAARYGETVRAHVNKRDLAPEFRSRKERRRLHRRRSQSKAAFIVVLQDRRCYLCGDPFGRDLPPTVEHVTPRFHGGRTRDNILMACFPCNGTKSNRLPYPCELIYLDAINAIMRDAEPVEPRASKVKDKAGKFRKDMLKARAERKSREQMDADVERMVTASAEAIAAHKARVLG